jgi:hypothetical protein
MSLSKGLARLGVHGLLAFSVGLIAGFRLTANSLRTRSTLERYALKLGAVLGSKEDAFLHDSHGGPLSRYMIPVRVMEGLCISGHDEFELAETETLKILVNDGVNLIAFEQTSRGAEILIVAETVIQLCLVDRQLAERAREYMVAYAERLSPTPRQVS